MKIRGKKNLTAIIFARRSNILARRSDLDAEIIKVVHHYSDGDDIGDGDEDEFIKNIASDLSTTTKSGEPFENSLAEGFNCVKYNSISYTEKLD